MNDAKPTSGTKYHSPLRASQALATRERIAEAVFAVFQKHEGREDITFKEVAKEAGVTEMTVYRHFPNRENLMQVLWERVHAKIGVRMPETIEAMLGCNLDLHLAYESLAPLILASITSRQGREMRLSHKAKRQKSFLKVADEVGPRLSPKKRKQIAAILQLLQSSYAWDNLRSNWDMDPKEIADATRFAIEALIASAQTKEKS